MREIKFRAWIEGDGKVKPYMTYLNPYERGSETIELGINLEGQILKLDYEHYYPSIFRPDFKVTLMQFTGLKDKNGKEIYEGDIVEITSKGVDENHKKVKETNQRVVKGLFFAPMYAYEHESEKRVKIVGNIYEDKELLK